MARVLLQLSISVFAVTLVAGDCNNDVINKIKSLGINTSNVLKTITGEFFVSYATAPLDATINHCPTSTFFKDGNDYEVRNNWVANGVVTLRDGGDSVDTVVKGEVVRKTYPIFQSADNTVYAFYSCSINGKDLSLGYVLVKTDSGGDNSKAITRMKSLGLNNGSSVKSCAY